MWVFVCLSSPVSSAPVSCVVSAMIHRMRKVVVLADWLPHCCLFCTGSAGKIAKWTKAENSGSSGHFHSCYLQLNAQQDLEHTWNKQFLMKAVYSVALERWAFGWRERGWRWGGGEARGMGEWEGDDPNTVQGTSAKFTIKQGGGRIKNLQMKGTTSTVNY